MKAMQILLLNHNVAYTGGATFYRALHIGKGLASHGHQVTLIASSASSVLNTKVKEEQGLQLVQAPGIIPSRWRYGFDPYETLRRLLWVSKRSYDITHAFDSRPTVIYPALFARRMGSRLVMDWCDWFGRGGAVEQRTNPVQRTIMRRLDTYYEEAFRTLADATTVINASLEQRVIRLGVAGDTILRLPNGADTERIQPMDLGKARLAQGLSDEGPVLGYLGSLFAADARLLLEAFGRVRQTFPEARLLLIGEPKTEIPPLEGVLRTGFVSYPGLNQALSACDILLLPMNDSQANRGRWPSKIGDYFAAGRPIVTCAVGDMQDVMRETGAGLATSPAPQPFAEGILSLLDNPDLCTRMGMKARQAAESRYNWQTLVDQVENLYYHVLS